MKTVEFIKYILFTFWGVLTSCNTDELVQSNEATNDVTMIAENFKYDTQSRTDFDITNQGAIFKWSKGDKVGVFPTEGTQTDFCMTSGEGCIKATFNGGGWALKPSSKYMAYYPLIEDFNLDKTAIHVSLEGQIQVGKSSTAHLGKYDYMAASAVTPEKGNVKFRFKHLCALVELNITVPNKGDLTSVKLSSEEAIFTTKGTVDLTSTTPMITSVVRSKSINVELRGVTTEADKESIKIYIMMAPVDLTGKKFTVSIVNNGVEHKGSLETKKMEAGKAYRLSATVSMPCIPTTVEWIDLELPSGILWASHNIGASRPEEYGSYFAWGEIMPKTTYIGQNSLTYEKEIGNIAGDPQYDAATAIWGNLTRMPTDNEIIELDTHTTKKWSTLNNVNGFLITSNRNGKSIFLPAAGRRYATSLDYAKTEGYYWCGTNFGEHNNLATLLNLNKDIFGSGATQRYFGHSIRPVQSKK